MKKDIADKEITTKEGQKIVKTYIYEFDETLYPTVQEAIAATDQWLSNQKIKQAEFDKKELEYNSPNSKITELQFLAIKKEFQDWQDAQPKGYVAVSFYVESEHPDFITPQKAKEVFSKINILEAFDQKQIEDLKQILSINSTQIETKR